jgi:ComF family protein
MRDAVHALKYDRLHSAARGLGLKLAVAIAQLAPDAPTEMLVVPVPLHRSKSADRGFNQARLLADEALSFLHKWHPAWQLTLAPSTLKRLRVTSSQAGLTPRQRRLNVRGAFGVSDPAAVQGKHVLLVDDIFTTGATLARAYRLHPVRFNFAASLADVADDNNQHGNAPGTHSQQASMHSQNQPSF